MTDDDLTSDDLLAAAVACERASLLPGAEYMQEIAEKLRLAAEKLLLEIEGG